MGRKVSVCCPFVYWGMSDFGVVGCEIWFPGPVLEIDLSATHILSYQGNLQSAPVNTLQPPHPFIQFYKIFFSHHIAVINLNGLLCCHIRVCGN